MVSDTPGSAIEVDYVIVFQLPTSKSEDRREQWDRAEHEYLSLLDTLRDCELEATGRPGTEGSNTILVFVRATDERLKQAVQDEQ
jgi:hypothetical protein